MSTTISPPTTPAFRNALERVIAEVVAPVARDIDATGAFPRHNIEALGGAGLLGLMSAPAVGGPGLGLRDVAEVIERLAGACGSTAMVVLMHYAAVGVLEAHGPRDIREAVAAGRHLCTLAFSEAGSRSHFWAPLGTAKPADGQVRLDAQKSWVTSAGQADSYIWTSLPLAAEGPMTLWLFPARADGLSQPSGFDGLGLRGNGSTPVTATAVQLPLAAMLGADGAGLDLALTLVLPTFQVLSTAFSLGLMEAVTAETAAHLTATRLGHIDRSLAQQPTVRLDFARMRVQTDTTRALLLDTLTALETQRPDGMLRVLESKAAAAEAALAVTDLAMKVCGGAAFRKELGIERRFRDARAARVMAPTTDALLDFIGRATLGLPLFEDVVAR
ncbi:MAG TPA: acyl-CoA dehydrogenase family protein [Chloroflexota bacterium]|nr:acyl-CoA dehydrogenase family protein [Chloroflexota bacterium]